MEDNHLGVDFGSKLAGTTAAAMVQQGQLQVWQCEKRNDADAWLQELVRQQRPNAIYIDAPLTLPKVYGFAVPSPAADFFYRQADREVQAMSPMFLGGLTARAMRLRAQLASQGIAMLETYPAEAARLLLPQLQGYKQDPSVIPDYAAALQRILKYKLHTIPENWHQVDAILCWLSGHRHQQQQSILYGDPYEGRIIV